MSVATLAPPRREALVRGRRLAVRRDIVFMSRDQRRPTLDDLLVGVWEGLRTNREAGCPVCGGAMRAVRAAGRPPLAARCSDCGSTLS